MTGISFRPGLIDEYLETTGAVLGGTSFASDAKIALAALGHEITGSQPAQLADTNPRVGEDPHHQLVALVY